ncbi:MAG: mechanosensitive ion channel, partial [Burkholderiales bacterium]|nr:mechanosensitive ion channel [Burkholderiales bacterium]
VAVLISLAMVGIDLTVLSVFGGALGVGIGLGLQKIASNYVSGFVILLDRSLKIGDMISVDKYYGRVTQINTRYTVLQGLDGIESVIPNEMLVSGVVQNFSLSDNNLRLGVNLTVGYRTDIEQLLPEIEAVVRSIERVVPSPEPQAIVVRFGDNGIDLEVGFWISDPENGRGGVKSKVNLAIWRLLQERGVELPFPQREIRIVEGTLSAK